jgi:serine/threonine-protein kinase HipA
LLRRAEIRRAKETGKRPRTLTEADYLLGANDEARQGALRFRETPQGPFQAPPQKDAIPPLITLPKLLAASERFLADSENAEDLRLLLAPGSSLGGARPKASVYDKDGSLSIAKFPRKDDEFNAILWEALALTLAKRAGIQVPLWRLERFLDKPVLILQRFDRRASGIRVPFLSAMSMLDARDNEQHSYLEIAYALSQYGAAPKEDLTELWRRMVFTILISNTDNHLRNHGFLHDGSRGWRLAPAYDLNPTPLEMKPHVLSTAIDFNTNEASLEAALQVIGEFRLKKDEAEAILKHVRDATAGWRAAAKSLGINRQETERMASAFV